MDFSPLFFLSSNCVLFKFEHAANTQGAAQQEDPGADGAEVEESLGSGCRRWPNHVMRHANIVKTLVARRCYHSTPSCPFRCSTSSAPARFLPLYLILFSRKFAFSILSLYLRWGERQKKKEKNIRRLCVYLNLFS